MIFEEEAYLAHYGILRKSGRYPWGSGETQSARNRSFLDTVDSLRKEHGWSDVDIAKSFEMTTTELRALRSIAGNQQRQELISNAQKLKEKGYSNVAIGQKMGINESSVRNLLAPGAAEKADMLQNTADMLRRQVEEKKYVDVGAHVGIPLGITSTQLKTAIAVLDEEGTHKIFYIKERQLGTGKETTYKVLAKVDTPWKEINANKHLIGSLSEKTDDHGRTEFAPATVKPISISSSRLSVRYKENGGDQADGVIYVRPGAKDLDMGGNRYAQVRIAIDGTHYLKGMAIVKDDLPHGVDLEFNTNKSNTGNKLDALKPLKKDKETGGIDADLPFGSVVHQLPKYDQHGNILKGTTRSAINMVNEEGQWDKWSRSLSSQFLSKQSPTLAKEQLGLRYEQKKRELASILALTNPEVKKKLLESFSDDMDSSAYRLKAMALPRQRTQVILPISSLKDNEIYAPNFRPGERVVLVRHPHGGTFEIPELVVNNKNKEGIRLLGKDTTDAVGINHKVAARLSGADFDGDTVLVIPNNTGRVKVSRPLEGLKHFDPQSQYKAYEGMKPITAQQKQHQMGLVSNLITDMTIKGATHDELAAAVRHSMVVIDAEKHNLDYKRSARENGVPALMKKYQGRATGGSSTLISRAKKEVSVDKRKPRPASEGGSIDPATGKRMFVPTGESYINRQGKLVVKQQKVNDLLEQPTAHNRVSDINTKIESVYADHSDRIRSLGDEARKAMVNTKSTSYSPTAKAVYTPQVKSLNEKLNRALANAPLERKAQLLANTIVASKKASHPDMEASELKKIKGQALTTARIRVGAQKDKIDITPLEWEAIQAGAISSSKLNSILTNTDVDHIKALATPRQPTVMTSTMSARAQSMLSSGYSQSEVADHLGIALSTLKSSLGGDG